MHLAGQRVGKKMVTASVFAFSSTTKGHRWGDLNNRNFFIHNFGGRKPKMEMSVGLTAPEPVLLACTSSSPVQMTEPVSARVHP